MGFARCNSVLNLTLPFPDSHGVMGFSCFGVARLLDGFKVEWGGSSNDRAHDLVVLEPDCGSQ